MPDQTAFTIIVFTAANEIKEAPALKNKFSIQVKYRRVFTKKCTNIGMS